MELESVEAGTLAEALDAIVARRGNDGRLRSVLDASSFLVDGAAASRGAAPGRDSPDAAVIEALPQFARPKMAPRRPGDRGGRSPPPGIGRIGADWVGNALQCPYQHVPKSHSGVPWLSTDVPPAPRYQGRRPATGTFLVV